MIFWRVQPLLTASALVSIAWLPILAQDYKEALQRGALAWQKGACKDAESAFQQAWDLATRTVGVVERDEQVRIFLRLTDASVCVGDYGDALKDATILLSIAPPELRRQVQFLRAEAEKGQGHYGDADADYAEAIRFAGQDSAETGGELARLWAAWSELARFQGDFAQADARIRKALEIADNPPDRNSPVRAYCLLVAGDLLREHGELTEARQRYIDARAITQPLGPEHPVAAGASLGLGLIDLVSGKLDLADSEIRVAERASRRTTTSDLYLRSLGARGMLELAKGNLHAAEDSFRVSLETEKLNRGERHPGTAISLDHLGLLYLAQQHIDEAIEQFHQAEEIQRSGDAGEHPDLAATLKDLGRAYRLKGTFPEAERALEEALRIQRAKLGKESLATASTRFERASLFAEMGRMADAESSFREALSVTPAEMPLHFDSVRGLALVLHREGKDGEAGQLIAEWMRLRGKNVPLADPERLPMAFASAEISLQTHQYSHAEGQFRAIMAAAPLLYPAQKGLADALFGEQKWPEAERLYASSLPNLAEGPGTTRGWAKLASCYANQKLWPESTRAAQIALKLASQSDFPEGERQGIVLLVVEASCEAGSLDQTRLNEWLTARGAHSSPLAPGETRVLEKSAQVLKATGQNVMAEKVLRLLLGGSDGLAAGVSNLNQILADFAEVSAYQNENAQAAETYERLAKRMQAVHRLSDSEKYLLEAKKLCEEDGGPDGIVTALQSLAEVYLLERKYAAALPLFEQVGGILKQRGLMDDPRYAASLNGLGEVVQSRRDFDQAESLFNQAYNLLSRAPNPPNRILASVLFNLGNLKLSNGKVTEAYEYFERCLQLRRDFTPENPPPVDEYDRIAAAYAQQNDPDLDHKAEELYRSNLALRRNFFGENSTDSGWGLYSLADFYNSRRAYDKAAEDGEQALSIFEKNAGPASYETAIVLYLLADVYCSKGDDKRAIAANERSLEIIETGLARPREEVTMILNALGVLYRDGKYFDKALNTYQRLAALWKNGSPGDPNYVSAVRNIVVSYVYLKDFENGRKWYYGLQASLQKYPMRRATAAKAYADALRSNGREKDARKIENQAGLQHPKKAA